MISTYKNLKQIFAFAIALFLLLGAPLLFPLNAYATINETFNFQAKLTNVNGTNVTDGTYNFRFSIYDASAAGNCLWTSKGTIPGSGSCTYAGGSPGTDLVAVTVTNGLFNVNLGTTAGGLTDFENVSAALAKFSNNSLYLDIQVYNGSSWETFGSRKLLESVPYAFRAKYADTSTNVPLSGITAATTTNTIDNLLNAQTWNWSTLSTQTALSYSANSLTTGGVLGISSSTTAASASGDLVKFELTGNSANVTGNALKVGVTGGSSTTATALNVTSAGTGLTFRVNDDGTYTDSTPFIIDTSGNVAIGATSATARLSVSPATTNTGRAIDAGASQTSSGTTYSIYNPISLSGTDTTANVYGLYNTGSSNTVGAGGAPTTRLIGVYNAFTASATSLPAHDNRIIGMYTDLTTTGTRNPIGYGTYFVTNSGSSSGTQYVNYADMSAGTTTKWGLYFTGESNNYLSGNLGIGDSSPASALTVGNNDLFQVNSSGNIVKINNVTTSFPGSQGGANSLLLNDGSGNLSWVTSLTGVTIPISKLAAATATNTIDNTLYAQQWDWSTLSTQNGLTLTGNALTTGNILGVTSSTIVASGSGDVVKFEQTGNSANFTGNTLKVGITGASSAGVPLNVTNAGTGFSLLVNDDGTYSDSSPFSINASGDVGIGTTTPDSALEVKNSGFPQLTLRNGGSSRLWIGTDLTDFIFKASNDYSADSWKFRSNNNDDVVTINTAAPVGSLFIDSAGNVGLQDITPASAFTVGNGDLFQVNSSGNIVKINNVTTSFPGSQGGSNTYLKNNGSGVLTWDTVSASASINGLTLATGTNTIDNTLYAQQWDWSTLSTQNALTLTGNGITTGNLLSLTSTSTALTSSSLLNILATGDPTASWTGALAKVEYTTSTDVDINGDILRVGITGAGAGQGTTLNITSAQTGTNALAFRVNDDGTYTDSTPFVVDKAGNVGIGTTTPKSALHSLVGTTGTMAFPYESAAFENSGDNKVGVFTSGAAFGNGAALTFGDSKATNGSGRIPGFELQYIGNTASTSTYIRLNYLERDSTAGTVTASAANLFNVFGGAATANGRVAIIGGGNSYNTFSVGASGEFQVDSSGNIVKINNVTTTFPGSQGGSNTYLKNDGSGGLTWASVSAAASLSSLTVATGTNTIDNTLYAQQWDWSTLTTENALSLSANGITTGNLLRLTSSSTALTSSSLLNILATGTPGSSWTGTLGKIEYTTSTSSNINGDALRIGITGAGAGQGTALNITTAQTGTNALAFRVNDDGTYSDSTPFVIDKAGYLGIGTTAPASIIDINTNSTSTGISLLSGNASNHTNISIGRASSDLDLAAVAAFNNWSDGANAGDSVIRANTSSLILSARNGTGGVQLKTGATDSVKLLVANNGNVAIGSTTTSYNKFSVGGSGQFQVDSNGNIVKINNVTTSFPGSQGAADSVLVNNGSGTLTWGTTLTGVTIPISKLAVAAATNTIDNTLYAQQWDWSTLSTQNAFTLTGNGITTGNLLSLTSTSTALTSSSLLNILATGDPAASWTGALAKIEYTTSTDADINGDGLRVGITGAGAGQGTTLNITSAQTGTNAFVFKVNDDGTYSDTTAFSVDKAGVVRAGGQYLAPDGAIATPSFGFLNNTNMGFYRQANNVMGTSVNGQGGFFLDGTSGTGRVSIDYPVAAASKFQISNDANTTAGGITLGTNASTYIQLYKSGSNMFTIGGGSVGIGDTAPASLFTVGSGGLFQVNSSGNIVASGLSAMGAIVSTTSGQLTSVTSTTGNFLRHNGTTWVANTIQSGDIPTGSANYIQNQSSSEQSTSNFWISGIAGIANGDIYSGGVLRFRKADNSAWDGAIYQANNNMLYLQSGIGDRITLRDSSVLNLAVFDKTDGANFFNNTDDNNIWASLAANRSRSSTTAPGAGFGTDIRFLIEGFTNNSNPTVAGISTFWENNQTNDTTDRDSTLSFSTMLDNTLLTRLTILSSGNVGIGDTTPASALTVGNADKFQVDTNGNIVKINNVITSFPSSQGGSNTYLKNNGSGVLTWDTVSASASISTLTLAGGTNTIDNTLYAQQWDWSTLSTQNALTLTGAGITTGNLLSLTSSSTAATSSNLLNILATGTPGSSWTGTLGKIEYTTSTSSNINGDALRIGITGAGAGQGTALNITTAQTGTNALAFRVNDDGTYTDSSPFIIDKVGSVGIGVTSIGSERLNIDNQLRLVTSGTPEAGYMFGSSIPSGSVTEGSGSILSYGINVPQTGTRNDSNLGGIFRLDTRGGIYENYSFVVYGYPASGGNAGYERLAINLQNGNTFLSPYSGNVAVGGYTATSMFNVGSSAQFQVNSSGQIVAAAGIISSGTIRFSALTTNGALYTSSSNGTLTSTAPTSGAIGYWSRTSTTLSPTTANDILSIANTTTTGADFGITNTGVYTGTGIFNLTANSATTGQLLTISGTGLTTGDGLKITGGSAMTTGNDLHLNGATYVHGANSEVGSLAQLEFADTTSGAYTSTTNGLQVQPTINITAGAAIKTINGISVEPTFTACTTATCNVNGINIANVTDSGNFNSTGLKIGTGWDEAIRANGSVVIGSQTDSASTGSSTYTLINSAAGTFVTSTDVSMDKISAAAVYEGKLFVATAEPSAAAVYRYDGGTTWVRVTSTTLGRVLAADTTVVDGYAMTVFDGKLWIGSQTGADNLAGVYWSTTADTASAGDNFTMVNSARGTINAATTAGISSMVVFYGNLIVATQKTDAADITRYDGGTTFTKINTTGKSAAETTADKDAFNLVVCGNLLYNGSISGTTTGVVASTTGNGTTWINTTVVATGGNFGAETVTSDIDSMVCYNGTLYISTSKTGGNSGAIYYYKATANPVSAVAANWVRINVAVGKMLNADSAVIDKFILRVYNGRLYAGSQTATGDAAGALFEYGGIPLADWTLMSTGARGTFGSQTSIDSISALIEFNGTFYVGTDDLTAGVGSVYTWSKTAQNSFALKFVSSAAAGENFGAISFVGDTQSSSNQGHTGSFIFSNSLQLDAGAFDYAEDYPTRDSSLNAGDLVTVDKNNPGYVVRTSEGSSVIGIVSKTPGFRLSSKEILPSGASWIPIALVGRVPLKVTSSNGTIQIGDRISTSSIKGVGMKSSGSGDTVGVALESFSVTDPNVIGEITVFVDLNYSDTHISKEEFEEYNISSLENTLDGTKTYSVSNIDSSKSINELGLFDQIKAGSITSGLLNTSDLTVNGVNFTSYITDLNAKLALLQPQTENILVPTVKKEDTSSNISTDITSEIKSDTNSEFELLKKQLISMIDDKFSSLSSFNTINTDVLGSSSTSINLPKLNTLSSKINILDDGSIEILGSVKLSELLNVESLKTKKISAYSGSDLIAELSDDNGKSKFSILSLTGKELFSVDSTGKTNINNDLTVKGDLNISGKIAGDSVFESKWIEIPANSEISIKHDLGVIPRSINVLRASDYDCDSKGGELDCTNVTNEGFGNKDVYYYKNLDKSFIKVVNALSDKIFVKVFVTK